MSINSSSWWFLGQSLLLPYLIAVISCESRIRKRVNSPKPFSGSGSSTFHMPSLLKGWDSRTFKSSSQTGATPTTPTSASSVVNTVGSACLRRLKQCSDFVCSFMPLPDQHSLWKPAEVTLIWVGPLVPELGKNCFCSVRVQWQCLQLFVYLLRPLRWLTKFTFSPRGHLVFQVVEVVLCAICWTTGK